MATDGTADYSGLKDVNRSWSFACSCFRIKTRYAGEPAVERDVVGREAMEAVWEEVSGDPGLLMQVDHGPS